MSGEKTSPGGAEAEYKYADETLGSEAGMEQAGQGVPISSSLKDKILTKMPKKKLGFFIVAAVAIFIIYKFLSAGNAPAPVPAEKALSQQLSAPATPAPAPTPVAVAPPPPPAAVAPQNLAALPAPSETNAASNAAITELQANMMKAQQDIAQMQVALAEIASVLNGLNQKLDIVEKVQQEQRHKHVMRARIYFPVYYIHSFLPDRVWLHTTRGFLTTVKVGDRLRGYGQIKSLDEDKGIVYTSSGREIRYGPYDS